MGWADHSEKDNYIDITTDLLYETQTKTNWRHHIRRILNNSTLITVTTDAKKVIESDTHNNRWYHSETTPVWTVHSVQNPKSTPPPSRLLCPGTPLSTICERGYHRLDSFDQKLGGPPIEHETNTVVTRPVQTPRVLGTLCTHRSRYRHHQSSVRSIGVLRPYTSLPPSSPNRLIQGSEDLPCTTTHDLHHSDRQTYSGRSSVTLLVCLQSSQHVSSS